MMENEGENPHTIEDHLDYFHRHLDRLGRDLDMTCQTVFDLEKIPIQIKQLESMGKYIVESLRDLEERVADLEKAR